jgi:hypothetical protein
MKNRVLLALALLFLSFIQAHAAEPYYIRTEDIVYGRLYGSALTMDVLKPTTQPNGAGVVWVVSGGWFRSAADRGGKSGWNRLR